MTEQNILSTLAKVFDPVGIISPVVVSAKILLQEVCVLKKGWDEEIEGEPKTKWVAWLDELKKVGEIIFNRCLYQSIHDEVPQSWLHGFGDASQRAYSAIVYLVYHQTSSVFSSLLAAKPRVAHVKKLTIPRLELTSARILAKLSTTVKNASVSQREIEDDTLWLDRKTALFWIENRGEWKQFVKNRVKEILALTIKQQWRYCPTYARGMIQTRMVDSTRF